MYTTPPTLLPRAFPTTTHIFPLKTTYTPPSICSTGDIITASVYTSILFGPRITSTALHKYGGIHYLAWYAGIPSCLPKKFYPVFFQYGSYASYFSPGVCPESFTIDGGVVDMGRNESAGVCCPVGYTYRYNWRACTLGDCPELSWCSSDLRSSTVAKSELFYTNAGGNQFTSIYNTSIGPGVVSAPAIKIRWKPSDFEDPPKGSISNSTKITLAVVIPIVWLGIVFGVFLFFRRRVKRKAAAAAAATNTEEAPPPQNSPESRTDMETPEPEVRAKTPPSGKDRDKDQDKDEGPLVAVAALEMVEPTLRLGNLFSEM